ncbi:hypothetical protein IE979_03385 [Klebsiella pneumoniae]|uniref:SMODS and SLOG-associating 2TM effector domain-containing protein n=1 Tax=Klebsiella pneumoniae TaxID=573 RepID=A0A927DPJ6_KLEPN|nr:hypothetical protein [Klebsiella pneumoniae]
MKYPSLYDVTNKDLLISEKVFLLLRLEYCILILNSVNAFLTYEKHIVALVLFSMLMLMMVLKLKTSEQEWYKYRAITESIKLSHGSFP